MPGKVAIITPSSLRIQGGDSLRPLYQALGLWEVGFRNFVVFSREPDPAQPFEQERIDVHGPAQFIFRRRFGCDLIHAHQNAGLFAEGRLWVDFHGFAPLESRCNWQVNRWSLRASVHLALSHWATPRLLRRSERVLCASQSIADHVRRRYPWAPPDSVVRNCLASAEYPPTPCEDAVVGVVGSFTTRWGEPAFNMTLRVAALCPELPFRLVGRVSEEQRYRASALPNVTLLGVVDEFGYRQFLQSASIALLPYESWCVGGGSRQKLLQAAASAMAVVATPAGLEGFDAPPEALIGGAPEALAEILSGQLVQSEERRRRGQALRRRVLSQHDYLVEARHLADLYEQALKPGAS